MLNYLRVFIKVVETGNFSKAAAVLNVAPSSVARNINALERELSFDLFERSTRHLRLTTKGEVFFDGALKIIKDADNLKAELSDNTIDLEGRLKISAFESFGRIHICPLISEFLTQHPKVRIEIELNNKIVDLYTDDIDVAIRVGIPKDSGLKARKLASNHTQICASPSYIEKYGLPTKPEQLQEHNCLTLQNGRQRTYWFFRQKHQNIKIQVDGNLVSKGGTPILSACKEGLGVIQISNWMVSDLIQTGDLVTILGDWESNLSEDTSGDIYAVYKSRSYQNPLVRAFIDFIVDKIGNTAS